MDGSGWRETENELCAENSALTKQLAELMEFVTWLSGYKKSDALIKHRVQCLLVELAKGPE